MPNAHYDAGRQSAVAAPTAMASSRHDLLLPLPLLLLLLPPPLLLPGLLMLLLQWLPSPSRDLSSPRCPIVNIHPPTQHLGRQSTQDMSNSLTWRPTHGARS